MRKTLIVLIICLFPLACSENKTETEQVNETEPNTVAGDKAPETPAPELSPELMLAQNNGCLSCHAVDHKIIGPAWRDVAKQYAADPQAKAQLIEKVQDGGTGNWIEVTGGATMPPYGGRVKSEDIEALVDFILSL